MKRVLALMLLLGTSAAADVVILNDGTRLEGQLTRSGSSLAIILADGSIRTIDDADLKSVQKTPTAVPPDAELASLRRQLASVTDPGVAVGKLREFIQRHPKTAAAAEAQKDLDIWQHRADSGLVRMGNDWVTPAQYATLKSQSGPAIENIRSLTGGEQIAGSAKALGPALKTWPANSSVLYLNGVALYRAKQLVPARQAFEAAAVGDPSNPAIHNNLAVILWQTHQQVGALAEYERALVGDTVSNTILDNVDEALHTLPPALASNAIAHRVAARYAALDTVRQAAMEQQGLHHYGVEWIDEAEYQKRLKADHAAQELISTYATQGNAMQRRLTEIDKKIATDTDSLHSIDQLITQVQPDGSIVQYDRPEYYRDIAKEVADLNVERIMKTKELRAMPKQLADARANPGPQWNGTQTLIGEEALSAPTTQPSTTRPVTAKP